MPRFQRGDYVKAEFNDEGTGESERMWVQVDSSDDEAGVLFGGSTTSRCWARASTYATRLRWATGRSSSTGRRRGLKDSRAGLAVLVPKRSQNYDQTMAEPAPNRLEIPRNFRRKKRSQVAEASKIYRLFWKNRVGSEMPS